MPTSAIKALATITLGSAQTTVTFSSISQAYRDLRLVISGKTSLDTGTRVTYNGDTTEANYFWVWMQAGQTSVSAGSSQNREFGYSRSNAGVQTYDIMDYTTANEKMTIGRTSYPQYSTMLLVERWTNTNVVGINSMALVASGTSWAAGTTFTLYGVSA